MHAVAEGEVAVEHGRLAYDIHGQGRPLVLIHGSRLDRRLWEPQLAPLAERYQVIRYDARGHGRSYCDVAPYAHERDLHALLQALAIPRATLIGLSMGGRIALQFALTYPQMVTALVVAGTGMDSYQYAPEVHAGRAAMAAALARGSQAAALEAYMALWIVGPHRTPADLPPAVLAAAREMVAHSFSHASLDGCEEPFVPPIRPRLAEIAVPTLTVVGEHDLGDMQVVSRMIAQTVPAARRVVIPAGGHLVNLEQPQQFTAAVQAFLATC